MELNTGDHLNICCGNKNGVSIDLCVYICGKEAAEWNMLAPKRLCKGSWTLAELESEDIAALLHF